MNTMDPIHVVDQLLTISIVAADQRPYYCKNIWKFTSRPLFIPNKKYMWNDIYNLTPLNEDGIHKSFDLLFNS